MKNYPGSYIIALLLLLFGKVNANPDSNSDKTQILVVGTIHENHYKNPNYSFNNLIQILDTYKPDVICVEIRPQDFRKVLYLKEMVSASIYGLKRNLKVCPIDWWNESDSVRGKRDEYMKTEEYKIKSKIEESKVKEDAILQAFEKKYGDFNTYKITQGYEFWNGEEYNRYIEESSKIAMEVYGDHPVTMLYKTRNDKMVELIKKTATENPGKKIIVLAGAEHKHYFDNALSKDNSVSLLNFNSILPLNNSSQDDDVATFLKESKAMYYFDMSDKQGIDNYYFSQLVPLVHSQGMDFKPEIIPAGNIKKVKSILDEWEKAAPNSTGLSFDLAWYNFLTDNILQAANLLEYVNNNIDQLQIPNKYLLVYRLQAMCYDLLGKREKAVECWTKAENLASGMGLPANIKDSFISLYIKSPFQKAKKN